MASNELVEPLWGSQTVFLTFISVPLGLVGGKVWHRWLSIDSGLDLWRDTCVLASRLLARYVFRRWILLLSNAYRRLDLLKNIGVRELFTRSVLANFQISGQWVVPNSNRILSPDRDHFLFWTHALRYYTFSLLDQIRLLRRESRIRVLWLLHLFNLQVRVWNNPLIAAFILLDLGECLATNNLWLAKLDVLIATNTAQPTGYARQFIHDLWMLVHLW